MKKLLFLLFFCSLFACSGPSEPVFKRVANISVDQVKNGMVTISADALFHNPNPVGGTLEAIDIDVWANDTEVGKIEQSLRTEIKGNSEFEVPLKFSFPLKEIAKNEGGLIGSLLTAVLNRKVDMEYKGALTVNVVGVHFDVPVDYEEEVTLK